MINDYCYIGIDTSNYTTSISACDANGKIIANVKFPLHVKMGDRGLRQSDAVFMHIKNFETIFNDFAPEISGRKKLAVSASNRPRSVEGSYMPCFLVGETIAKGISSSLEIPMYSFSHQDGHVMAALYSAMSGNEEKIEFMIKNGFAAFHVSGGTTEILLVEPNEKNFTVKKIGGTLDLNAGQVIDRTGVMMGLNFPCGAEMEKKALNYKNKLVKRNICVKGLECCLSGVENLARNIYEKTSSPETVSAFVFDYISRVIEKLTENLRIVYPNIAVVYAGGVMSNGIIKEKLSKNANVYFAEPQFSSDNAAGIALLCRRQYLKRKQ